MLIFYTKCRFSARLIRQEGICAVSVFRHKGRRKHNVIPAIIGRESTKILM